jgi:hypothetical protein
MKISKLPFKKIKEMNDDGLSINIFKSNREVAKFTGLSEGMICSILKNRRKSTKFELWI